jgi:integrase
MGYIRQRIDGRGITRYTAYYLDLRSKERSAGTFTRKCDAERAWRKAEAETIEGHYVNLATGRRHFHDYVTEIWLPNHVMEINTRQGYQHIITKYLMDGFGSMRMNEILPAHVRQYIAQLHDDGTTPHTLARCKTVLSAIFTTALNDRIVYLHPCAGVATPTIPPRPPRILTPSEFTAIVDAMQAQRWQLLTELTIETGLRWGEVAELRASDFHPPTRTLTVARTVIELHTPGPNGERFVVKHYPKNAEYRPLHLSGPLAHRLDEHIRQHQLTCDDLLFSFPHNTPDHDATNTVDGRIVPPGHGTMTPTPTIGVAAPPAEPPTPTTGPGAAPQAKTSPGKEKSAPPTGTFPANGSANRFGTPPSRNPIYLAVCASTTYGTPTPPGCSPEAPTCKPSANDSDTAACGPRNVICTPSPEPAMRHLPHSNASATTDETGQKPRGLRLRRHRSRG